MSYDDPFLKEPKFISEDEMRKAAKKYRDGYGAVCVPAIMKKKRRVADQEMRNEIARLRYHMIRSSICPDCGKDLLVVRRRWWKFWEADLTYYCEKHGELLAYSTHSIGGGRP